MSKSGYVYFVENAGLVKIGRTKNIKRRFKQFATTIPYARVLAVYKTLDMYEMEKQFHELYKRYRKRGEWFELPIGGGVWSEY